MWDQLRRERERGRERERERERGREIERGRERERERRERERERKREHVKLICFILFTVYCDYSIYTIIMFPFEDPGIFRSL